ncbi:MAG: Uma2 family endonuclease, partial [Deltaproteobacteria bacterium]|nr:Uma2 family endonuclease [Deltaproteobacteria bacterium]
RLENKQCEVYVAPFDVRLPLTDENDRDVINVVQPDLLVVCDPARLDERGCRGAPDFVIEIVSPSSIDRDQIDKAALYERAGVKEYWVINLLDLTVTIRRLNEQGAYSLPVIREGKGKLAVATLPDLMLDLDAVFGRERENRP